MPTSSIPPHQHFTFTSAEQIELQAHSAQEYLAYADADSSDPQICQKIKYAMLDVEAHERIQAGEPEREVVRSIGFRKSSTGLIFNKRKRKEAKVKTTAKKEYELLNGKSKGTVYVPDIYGDSRDDSNLGSVRILMSLCSVDLAAAKLDRPPLLKGGCIFGGFVVPVIAQVSQDTNGFSTLSLLAVDDPNNFRIVAVGRLIGNNDILRFDFAHRKLTIDCTHTMLDRLTGTPYPFPFDENFNLKVAPELPEDVNEPAENLIELERPR